MIAGSAIILAGGKSRRMGRDKAALPWGRATLLDHAARGMGSLFEAVIVVSGKVPREIAGTLPASDGEPGQGPLAGLLAGLRRARSPWTFVMACDMPFVKPDLVRFLWSHAGGNWDAVVPFAGGMSQPLCACYARTALPRLSALFEAGVRSLQETLGGLRVRWIEEAGLLRVDPALASFTGLNTPEEYRLAASQ